MATAQLSQADPQAISPLTFEITKEEIESLSKEHTQLAVRDVNDATGIKAVHDARMVWVRLRNKIDKRRKDEGESSRKRISTINTMAKELIELFTPTEQYLENQESIVKRENERIEAAAAEMRRAAIMKRVEAFKAAGEVVSWVDCESFTREQYEAALASAQAGKKDRDEQAATEAAERVRVAAEQKELAEKLAKEKAELERQRVEQEAKAAAAKKLEDDRFASERAVLEKQRAEQLAAQAKIDTERKRIHDSHLSELHKYEFPGQRYNLSEDVSDRDYAKIIEQAKQLRADYDAKQAAELEGIKVKAAELARLSAIAEQERLAVEAKSKADTEAAELKRLEELRPDREKIALFADSIQKMAGPQLSAKSKAVGDEIAKCLLDCARGIRTAGSKLK